MTQTPVYQYNIVEGTDIVNPLTQLNPNFTKLDNDLYGVAVRTIINATESVSGTVHTIVRSSGSRQAFRFVAAANWKAGDSMILDGNAVTVEMPDGTTPPDDSYVAGVEVFAIANFAGNKVTLYTSQKYIPTASEVTTSGGSVQDYIDNTTFKNLETWTPNIGENWETFLARIRDNSTKTIPANFIRCAVDGVSGLIFRQSRRTSGDSWQYETDYFTGSTLVKYAISVSATTATLRKYDLLNGTVTNLSTEDAQTINIYGLDV